ncbi:hypothetical protein [Allocoleopsis franciscana]|uniref:hypothetical protein n=1 Tax=Allocoleopsis franciscana TaxID=2886352 RepID=UPI0012DD1D4B|nr:hypothetical protein [Allocoleopsis franciscana]
MPNPAFVLYTTVSFFAIATLYFDALLNMKRLSAASIAEGRRQKAVGRRQMAFMCITGTSSFQPLGLS